MMNTEIGARFEKYVVGLLRRQGLAAERNLLYHKGKKRTCQVDVESRSGIIFSHRTIYECKYICVGNSLDFNRAYIQLGEALLFTGYDDGVIVTNSIVSDREKKERHYGMRIFDGAFLAELRFGQAEGSLDFLVMRIDSEIRRTPYNPDIDHLFRHKYL